MTHSDIGALCLREYGVLPTVAGVRHLARVTRAPRKIPTPGAYVGICRRIAQGTEYLCPDGTYSPVEGDARIDGRLVAVGHNNESPTRWLHGGGLQRFLAYWWRAAGCPNLVGSTHNCDPETAYAAMRIGVPARVLLRLGDRCTAARAPVLGRNGRARALPRRRIRRLQNAARAACRTSIKWTDTMWSTKALAALGRLCPELQRVAVRHTPEQPTIKVRDIAWADVARVQRQMTADPTGRVRVAWATGLRQQALFEELFPDPTNRPALEAFLAPAYPLCSCMQAMQIARGVSPSKLSGGLTRREAHRWLSECPDTPAKWLLESHGLGQIGVTDVVVARWLIDVRRRGNWSSLARERTARFGGQEYRFALLSRLDEIREEHLPHGPRTSVERAFRLAAESRAGIAAYRESDEVVSTLPEHWPALPSGIHLLTTPRDIVRRGDEHDHCVGIYVPDVRRGAAWLLSVECDGDVSTALISADRSVQQHHGPANSTPTKGCQGTLKAWLSKERKDA